MNYITKNQDAFTGGIIAVVLGVIGKNFLKTDVLPTNNIKQILTTFAIVSVAGIGANELKSKYPMPSQNTQ